MGERQKFTAQASTRSIQDLIQDCYQLERAGKMNLALLRGCEAEQFARSGGEIDLAASAMAAQALTQAHLGNYSKARNLAEEALSIASTESVGRAESNIVLGICSSETDDLDAAEAHYHSAADLCREIGDYHTLVRALHDLACGIYFPRGQFDMAIVTEQEVLQITNRYGISYYQDHAWTAQALVYLATDDFHRAREALDNLEKLASPESRLVGYLYCLRAHLHQSHGELEDAFELYTQALAIAETAGDPGLSVEIRWGLSRLYRMRTSFPEAYSWAEAAVNIASRFGYHHMEGRALVERGRVSWEMNNPKAAMNDFQSAIQRLEPLKANYDLCNARLLLTALLYQIAREPIPIEGINLSEETLIESWRSAFQGIIDHGYGFILEREWRLVFPLVTSLSNHLDPHSSEMAARVLILLQRSPPPLHINTLGHFRVYQGSRRIPDTDWRQRQAGELFRLLLVSPGRRLSREQIIEALWPEKPVDVARASFHQTTSALRRVLEPELPEKYPSRYLLVEEGLATLRLPPGSQVDFETFERYVRQGELDAALALFRGEPFPLDMYHDWAASTRERLNQQYIEVLLNVANRKLSNNDPQGTLEACRRLLSMDPWQEKSVLIGMQAYLAMNDRTSAIRLYRELERCLRDDLGIAPTPELSQLYQSLL
jgi:DNA-binding SARP family transcriptional activator/Tfp pilus assembly protein PilF